MSRTVLILLLCTIIGNINCYLIDIDEYATKNIPVNTEDEFEGDVDDVNKIMGFPNVRVVDDRVERKEEKKTDKAIEYMVDNKLDDNTDDQIVDVDRAGATNSDKKCAAIGEFCMNHSDCCTYACLGYMKRCVSG